MAEILEDPVKLTDDLDVLALPNPDSNDLLVRDDQAQDDTPNLEGDKERGEDIDIRGLEDFIARSKPQTELEKALFSLLDNKNALIHKMSGELQKLQAFVVKRKKQVYKRKRKDADHPVKPLSAYNIFLRERFEDIKKQNEKALKSEDANAQMTRVPPSSLVQKTASEWKAMTAEMKQSYKERAREDKKRYEQEMDNYRGTEQRLDQKRTKTAYNIFFSSHAARRKEDARGVPSERGSIARIVANAWKALNSEEKKFYEEEAEKFNSGHVPVAEEELEIEHEEHDEEDKIPPHMDHHYAYDMHPMGMPMQHPMGHDPRGHLQYYPPQQHNPYPYNNYDYSQHQQRGHSQGRPGYYY